MATKTCNIYEPNKEGESKKKEEVVEEREELRLHLKSS